MKELMENVPPVNVAPRDVDPPVTLPEAPKEMVIVKGPNKALFADPDQVPCMSASVNVWTGCLVREMDVI